MSLLGETKRSERSAFRELVMCESAYYWQCITLFVSHAHSVGTDSNTALHIVVWRKIYKSTGKRFTKPNIYLNLPKARLHQDGFIFHFRCFGLAFTDTAHFKNTLHGEQ